MKQLKIYLDKRKSFKTIWLTDETSPSPKYCDLLINDYPEANKFRKYYLKYNKKIKLLLGIYSFLFQEKLIKNKSKKQLNKHILIVFGGDDPKNLILKYLKLRD